MGKGEKFSVEGDPHVYPPSPKPIPHFKDFQRYRIPDEGWFYGWKRGACRFCLKRQECIYTFALPGDESLRTDTARFPLPSLPLAKVLGGRGEAFEEGRGGLCPERFPLSPSQCLILSSHIHDPLMKTQVIGQLGMEGGGEDVPLPHGNGEPVDPGEYLHAGADLFNGIAEAMKNRTDAI